MLDLHLYPEEVCEMLVIAAYRDMDVKLQFTKSIFSEFPLMHDCQKCLIEPTRVLNNACGMTFQIYILTNPFLPMW